jgi:hypothetical protein
MWEARRYIVLQMDFQDTIRSQIAKEDRHKTTFSIEWGSYQYTMMPFGLKNAPTIFSRVVVKAFKEFFHKFLEAYFDDRTVFHLLKNHIELSKANVG